MEKSAHCSSLDAVGIVAGGCVSVKVGPSLGPVPKQNYGLLIPELTEKKN